MKDIFLHLCRELSSNKFYSEVGSLQNLIGNLVPPNGHTNANAAAASSSGGGSGISSGDALGQAVSAITERFRHASNHEGTQKRTLVALKIAHSIVVKLNYTIFNCA
jgi:hypothetical protein